MLARVRHLLISFLPALAWYGVIFWLSSQSHLVGFGDDGWRDFTWFKLGHTVFYAIQAATLWWGWSRVWPQSGAWSSKRASSWFWLAVIVSVVVLSYLDEVHQSFVPGRHPRVFDIGVDTLAASAALFCLERYNAKVREYCHKFGM